MKNKYIGAILAIVAIVIVGAAAFILPMFNESEEYKYGSEDIIVEKAYANGAWGYVYYGSVIFGDGKIYSFEVSEKDKIDGKDRFKNFVLKNGEYEGTVNKKDLEILQVNASKVKDTIKTKNVAIDAGSHFVNVHIPNSQDRITLRESGDFEGKNKTNESLKILKIVDKYID